jgi:polysaccharide biosynthesis transport protein
MVKDNANVPARIDQANAGNNLPSTEFRESIPNNLEEEIDLRDYIEVILRRKWLVLGVLFFIFMSTLIFSLSAKKLYRATGTIEVSTESQKVTKFEDVVSEGLRSQEFIATQVSLLKSTAVADRVIQAINLKDHPIIAGDDDDDKNDFFSIAGINGYIKSSIRSIFEKDNENVQNSMLINESIEDKKILDFFQRNLEVTPNRNSMIINVSFISPSRQLSQDVVNHLMEEFVAWKMDQRMDSSGKARQYLMKQIDRAKINLEEAEEKQHQFARQAGIVSMDSRLNNVFRQLEDINATLGQAEADLISKETLYEQALKDGPESLPQVLNNQMINDLKKEDARLRSEYENLIEIFHEDYPEVKTIKSRMNSIDERVTSESGKIFNSIRHEYLSAKNRFEVLQKNMEEKKQLALELNERATQYTIMSREVETNKAIYQSLLERAKEIESMAGISPSNIQVVDNALLPIFPSKPNVRRNLLLAIVVGLMAGLGIAFLIEYFSDTITNPDQITERFQIPILGVLPLEMSPKDYPVEQIFTNDPRSPMSEAFRTSRVSIELSGSGSNSRCIGITSTTQGEGKSTTASNLAQTFAGAGEKVLLIDADLRRPRLHKIFKTATANNGHGLSSFLAGVVHKDFITKTDINNLYLIPSGPIPPNPVELLASNRFSQLLKKSAMKFDRIIIDGPPHLGFADVLVLSRKVGGMILVSSIGETTRDGLRHFKKSMHNVQGTILGCIVNKINLTQRYGYRSYYKYYKAYHYDYGHGHEKKGVENAENQPKELIT